MSKVYILFSYFLLQIDSSVVGDLDNATMVTYILAYGDRIATRRFCLEKNVGIDTKRLSSFKNLQKNWHNEEQKQRSCLLKGKIQCDKQICIQEVIGEPGRQPEEYN